MRSNISDSGSFWITKAVGMDVPLDMGAVKAKSLRIARRSLRLASSLYATHEVCQQKIVGTPSMKTVVSRSLVWLVWVASPGHLHRPWLADCQSTDPTISSALRWLSIISRIYEILLPLGHHIYIVQAHCNPYDKGFYRNNLFFPPFPNIQIQWHRKIGIDKINNHNLH